MHLCGQVWPLCTTIADTTVSLPKNARELVGLIDGQMYLMVFWSFVDVGLAEIDDHHVCASFKTGSCLETLLTGFVSSS